MSLKKSRNHSTRYNAHFHKWKMFSSISIFGLYLNTFHWFHYIESLQFSECSVIHFLWFFQWNKEISIELSEKLFESDADAKLLQCAEEKSIISKMKLIWCWDKQWALVTMKICFEDFWMECKWENFVLMSVSHRKFFCFQVFWA